MYPNNNNRYPPSAPPPGYGYPPQPTSAGYPPQQYPPQPQNPYPPPQQSVYPPQFPDPNSGRNSLGFYPPPSQQSPYNQNNPVYPRRSSSTQLEATPYPATSNGAPFSHRPLGSSMSAAPPRAQIPHLGPPVTDTPPQRRPLQPSKSTPPPQQNYNTPPMPAQAKENDDDILMMSIRSAVDEKIQRHLDKNSVDTSIPQRLKQNEGALIQMIQTIQSEQMEISRETSALASETERLFQISAEQSKVQASIENDVTATCTLHNQILKLVAERNTLEDTIFFLGSALNKKAIKLEDFITNVRVQSHQLFLTKALLKKALEEAGFSSFF